MRRHWRRIQDSEYPEIALLESAATVTAEKARGWFTHSGYNLQ